ncbi:hypothetical protein [Streptomyces antimycoticus]|uniref:hypothetical protein n=1 Tax=Streptomyces antimycoticus TaxID=68175 RepID=UPI001374C306|nr:hypothetical protein [Streptomyces antimycoticus]
MARGHRDATPRRAALPFVGLWRSPADDALVRVSEWLDGHDPRRADVTSGTDVVRAAT